MLLLVSNPIMHPPECSDDDIQPLYGMVQRLGSGGSCSKISSLGAKRVLKGFLWMESLQMSGRAFTHLADKNSTLQPKSLF